MAQITLGKALNLALHDSLASDPRVLVYGEDVGKLGGVFRVTDGLQATFGEDRVFDTPLAESAIAGIAVGLALKGFKPVAEMQFDAFSYPAFNQVTSNIAKYTSRTQGDSTMPVVIRIPYGGKIGAVEHHSESPETYYVHTAGLKVVTPSTPADAYALLTAAIADPDPVIFLEPKARYQAR
ncbi:MAG TPA: alpha-ketoacid dehydrogenase subunit beta, partial [Ktedonobacterales bacterium]